MRHHHDHQRPSEHSEEHVHDPAKFASYDDDADDGDDNRSSRDAERHAHRHKEHTEHAHRAESVRRPFSNFRGSAQRDATSAPYGQTATSTATASARATDTSAAAPATDPPAYPASNLHPYDHHRAALIGLSTALVAAIVIIVALMAHFSSHSDLAPAIKQDYEARLTTYQQNYQDCAGPRRAAARLCRRPRIKPHRSSGKRSKMPRLIKRRKTKCAAGRWRASSCNNRTSSCSSKARPSRPRTNNAFT